VFSSTTKTERTSFFYVTATRPCLTKPLQLRAVKGVKYFGHLANVQAAGSQLELESCVRTLMVGSTPQRSAATLNFTLLIDGQRVCLTHALRFRAARRVHGPRATSNHSLILNGRQQTGSNRPLSSSIIYELHIWQQFTDEAPLKCGH